MAINQLPSGRYQVKLQRVDRTWTTHTFDTKREAQGYEAQLKKLKREGSQIGIANRVSLDEFFAQWFAWIKTSGTPSWRRQQERLYQKHIQPFFGHRKLSEVRTQAIAEVLGAMVDGGYSESVRQHVFTLLRKIFGDASNVFDTTIRNPVKRELRPKLSVKEAKYLNVNEVRNLLLHVQGKPYELAIGLGLYLGLRVGEAQALRWQDVDFEQGIVHIRRTYSKHENAFRDYPKGKRQHSKKIPFELLALLKQAAEVSGGTELVVVPPRWSMLDYWAYRKALRRYCTEAGITVISTHGLRHSASELYMSHGATRDDLRLLFAHTSSSTTDRYIHDKGTRLEEVAKIIQLFPKASTNLPRPESQNRK